MADTFADRWRSPAQVGDRAPKGKALIRLGRFRRGYHRWTGMPVDAAIYGETLDNPWSATWEPTSDWFELPNAEELGVTQDYDANGLLVGTISMTNVALNERIGALGDLYHAIERGWLSPWRGHGLASPPPRQEPNEWSGMLDRKAQVKILNGYGDALEPEFTGLIDDCDLTSAPDKVTITARSFGQVLADEHVFGWAKSKQLPEPVVFEALGALRGRGEAVGTAAAASTSRDGHPPRFVTDDSTTSAWMSHDHADPDNTEWVEIRLPRGRYESIALHAAYPDMEVFAGIYASSKNQLGGCQLDGRPIADGWIQPSDLSDPSMGGEVPGDHGGWPYVKRWPTMTAKGHTNLLSGVFYLGDDSVLRVGFRNLRRVTVGVHRAGVVRLAGIRRHVTLKDLPGREGGKRKMVEVSDVSEIVKVVLRWAGYKEWIVESTGVGMDGQIAFNRGDTLISIINKVKEVTGFVFYELPPTDDDLSIGVPVFESNLSIAELPNVERLGDDDLLTGIQSKATDEPLATDIRVRGKLSKKYGQILGNGQSERRVMAHYKPPWGIRTNRMGGVIKHVIEHYDHVRHTDECLILAQLIALAEALASTAAEVEIPGTTRMRLNRQVFVSDVGTGIHSRLYIARRSSTFRASGANGPVYTTTLGGALIDLPDVQAVIGDLRATLKAKGLDPDALSGESFFAGATA